LSADNVSALPVFAENPQIAGENRKSFHWVRYKVYAPAARGGRASSKSLFSEPDDASIQAAIEANDRFIERLEQIRDAAQSELN